MKKNALLIDVTSIQKYVFSSNKLKENLGASFLISDLFYSMISKNEIVKNIPLKNGEEYEGYIGGGNALLFFNNKGETEKFVKEWTRCLLINAPGISISNAIGELDLDESNFQESRNNLFTQLTINKSKYIPQTIIPRHGISAECQSDGYSMDVWNKTEGEYVSASTNAKIEAFNPSKKKTAELFKDQLGNLFSFPDSLDDLGQKKGSENHIAIVHIDGNSIGDRFKAIKTLEETKRLSIDVENAIKASFKVLLEKIIIEINKGILKDYLNIKDSHLPIRPIIMGGDDITFVCDGRMGIYYAQIFMNAFQNQKGSDGKPLELTSCAGISIIKTKYPFYKGYQLAEELCANAKSKRREMGNGGSWLDFHIAYGGFSGSLNEIKNIHYKAPLGSLLYRPYKISDSTEYSFETFIANTKQLKNNWPNNKLKDLRKILTLKEEAIKTFVTGIEAHERVLPDIASLGYNKTLFKNGVTPYFDMIELLEYYPEYELNGSNK